MADTEMFDGILMNIVQKSEGIEGFYDSIFSFMRRKTDFYTNVDKGRSCVLGAFEKNATIFAEDKKRQELIKQKQEEKKREEQEAKLKAEQEAKNSSESDSKVEEITDEEAERIMQAQNSESVAPTPEAAPDAEMETDKKEGEGEDEEESGPPLVGNGITTEKYSFTQTLQDFTLNVFIPPGVKGKDLIVNYTTKKLKVQIKGQDPIIDGELPEKIKTEETLWTIDQYEGKRV